MSSENKIVTSRQLVELLTPSGISSVICVVSGMVFTLGVVLINRYRSSSLELQYKYYQAHKTVSNSHLTGTILNNSIINDLPLIIFWAVTGAVIYLIAADIVKAFSSAIELREELDYVHVHRKILIRDTLIKLSIRLIVIAITLPYLIFFFHRILPYAVKLSILATTASNTLMIAMYIVSSILLLSLAIHVIVVLARLLLLKPRVIT